MERGHLFVRLAAQCDEHKAPPLLGHAKISCIDNVKPDTVSESPELTDEPLEPQISAERWHVFHDDSARLERSRKVRNPTDQPIPRVVLAPIHPAEARESLTGNAGRQDIELAGTESKSSKQLIGIEPQQVIIVKINLRVVGSVGATRFGVRVDGGENTHASGLVAGRDPAGA